MSVWRARRRGLALTGLLVAVALLGGCATAQMAALDAAWPAELPAQVELTHVPFFPQEDFECGPASLAMVAGAAGVPLLPAALVDQVYLPGRQGSLQQEMMAATRRQGLLAYPLRPRVEDVLREVAAGRPVLVFQNLSLPIKPLWHYAVVMGYDRERNLLLLHSGRTERMEMSLFAFERTWARTGYWAMLALSPADRLPATAHPLTYGAAVSALERLDPKAAQVGYATALAAWPTDRAALLGAGNTAYAQKQWGAAIKAYRHATQTDSAFADAWNNLAQVLWEQGHTQEAAQAIAKAVSLGGERLPRYEDLARKVNKK
jgi:tetratricopeptide (TPR) repeat protein